jgi:hypothetical protein
VKILKPMQTVERVKVCIHLLCRSSENEGHLGLSIPCGDPISHSRIPVGANFLSRTPNATVDVAKTSLLQFSSLTYMVCACSFYWGYFPMGESSLDMNTRIAPRLRTREAT